MPLNMSGALKLKTSRTMTAANVTVFSDFLQIFERLVTHFKAMIAFKLLLQESTLFGILREISILKKLLISLH